jgi:hypothetical protein
MFPQYPLCVLQWGEEVRRRRRRRVCVCVGGVSG